MFNVKKTVVLQANTPLYAVMVDGAYRGIQQRLPGKSEQVDILVLFRDFRAAGSEALSTPGGTVRQAKFSEFINHCKRTGWEIGLVLDDGLYVIAGIIQASLPDSVTQGVNLANLN